MKLHITQKVDMTKETIKTSMDSFIKDEITGIYNEVFFKEYLLNYLNILEYQNIKKSVAIMLINVDNMSRFNIKYSNEAGDETINSLGYILNQTISEDDLLFKRVGPGYILLIHDYKGKNIKEYASKIQNAVKKSDAFIDEITVSVSVVCKSEVIDELENKETVEKLLYLAVSRINLSHRFQENAYIDQYTIFDRNTLGDVLVVEPDQLTLNIITRYLEQQKFQVTQAKDGVSAVEFANKKLFNAIIVDRYTQKLDGLTIKQHLNESSINMNTLFLLTVQNKDVAIIEKANQIGINFVIPKPIILEEILGIIERGLAGKECL